MALITAAAALAGTTAAAMFVDAKYAIRKDLHDMRRMRLVVEMYKKDYVQKRLSLYYWFEKSVKKRLNEDCIWSREGCYTWNQAYDRVHQWAQWFLAQGVKPKDLVAFHMVNSPDFILAWLGLWAVGAAPAMINYNLQGKALLHCLKVSGATLLVTDLEIAKNIEDCRGDIEGDLGMTIQIIDPAAMSYIRGLAPERPADKHREKVQGDWPMAIFYTSGTTGMPKGVAFGISRGYYQGASYDAGYSMVDHTDRWYNCMPYYHGTGGITALTQLMTETTLCVGKRFSSSGFWDDVRDSRATVITYVGEIARYLLAAPPSTRDKEHNVRLMHGNGLRPDVWMKFRERFGVVEVSEVFSSSEGMFSLNNYSRGDYLATAVGQHGIINRYKLRNTYVPVRIDTATGDIIRDPKTGFATREPYEKGGEIIVQVDSPKAFAGYHNNPEATMKKFDKDVFKKGDLWYRTGDALRRTNDGKWFFVDRLGDTFRWKGENVSTAEVAEVLGKFPGVVEANVYGVQLPSHDGRAGCAAVYIDPSYQKNFDFAGLLKYARASLPKYAVPVFIRVVKEMTPIHNFKQNKVPLREEGADPEKVKACDTMFWIDNNGKGHNYVEFNKGNWEDIKAGRARL